MPKRAQRRHHEERIKEKFKKVAKRWAGTLDNWTNKVRVKWDNGRVVALEHYIDRSGGARMMKYIEKQANRMAHHSKCDCGMCHKERYRTKRHHEKVLDKRYIDEGKDE